MPKALKQNARLKAESGVKVRAEEVIGVLIAQLVQPILKPNVLPKVANGVNQAVEDILAVLMDQMPLVRPMMQLVARRKMVNGALPLAVEYHLAGVHQI